MKQIIPFYKEIVFEKNIASIVSISLEHNEKILEGEISGDFILHGQFKSHNDTTELDEFRYKLPFTAILPDDVDLNTIKVDIIDFNYDQIDEDVLRVDIDFSIEGDELERRVDVLDYLENDDELLDLDIDNVLNNQCNEVETSEEVERLDLNDENVVISSTEEKVEYADDKLLEEKTTEVHDEYVTYHVHVVGSMDSVESIMKTYNVNLDLLKEYNDIKELKIGDKVLIPELVDE